MTNRKQASIDRCVEEGAIVGKGVDVKLYNRHSMLYRRMASTKHRTLRLWHLEGKYNKSYSNLIAVGRKAISLTLETEEMKGTQKVEILLKHMTDEEIMQNINTLRTILDSVELRILDRKVQKCL
jgi:hypothetical protein